MINEYGYKRFPLMKAFRRLLEGDVPDGCDGLSKSAVMAYSADLYRVDGQISYDRAVILGHILRSLTVTQKAELDALKALNGVDNWDKNLPNPLTGLDLSKEENVAVMTYASEMYSWYAGSVEADTYFCPERQGTYFGSFYMKDMPAMGNRDFSIPTELTADMGSAFLALLTNSQADLITDLVDIQRDDLYEIVDTREAISTQLRRFILEESVDEETVLSLTDKYGELDGAIVWNYATTFSEVNNTLSSEQAAQVLAIRNEWNTIPCSGAFLYSEPIAMPEIINTDFLFGVESSVEPPVLENIPSKFKLNQNYPNPFNPETTISFVAPEAGKISLKIYNVLGENIDTIVKEYLAAGNYSYKWQANNLPSGVYYYTLKAGSFSETKKMVLMR